LRPVEKLIAGNENMRKTANYFGMGKKSPDFDVLIQEMTKFSKKLEK